jgi:hypothetical protein
MPNPAPKRKARSKESFLAEAGRRCKQHGGIYFVTKTDCYLVYRKHPNGGRGIFVGRRSTPSQLAKLVSIATQSTGAECHE